MVPKTVLTRSGPISLNTARPVNTVQPRTAVNNAGPMKNIINNAYSTTRRPFNKIPTPNNSNFTKKVNIVKGTRVNTARPKAVLSAVKGNKGNVVKALACWGNPQQDLKNKGVINSGCSRHMTGNKSYLSDYEEINGGFVAIGGNSKGGKITGKDSKRRALWSLIEDILKSIDLKTNTPYPSRRYGVSVPALTKDHKRNEVNTPYPEDSIRRIQEKEYNILEDIKRGPYSKKSPIRRIQLLGYAVLNRLPDLINRKLKNEF
ncbi:hypothetical protein Tco_1308200 [Tanacetum coccineum]